jgi:hypothetical protein
MYVLLLIWLKKVDRIATNIEARKNRHRYRILRILDFFGEVSQKFKNNQILFDKISNHFQATTKLHRMKALKLGQSQFL